MKKRFVVLTGLLACTLLLSVGCESSRVESISFDSLQSAQPVTLNVSGYSEPRQDTRGQRYYGDKRTKQEMLDELKENDLTYFELYGHEFITLGNGQGTYHLKVEELSGSTEITIEDMACDFMSPYRVRTLFPAFMLKPAKDDPYYSLEQRRLYFNQEYLCNGAELLDLVKTLGLWTIEEKTDYFIMRYQTESIGVRVGDGTVTLECLATSLPPTICYDTMLGEEEIVADLSKQSVYPVQEYQGERYFLRDGSAYRLMITPLTETGFRSRVLLDPMITEISKADGSIVCTMPFPYFRLSLNGETCTDELRFNSTYDVDKRGLLLYLRSVRGWNITEDGDTVILRHYHLAVKLVFDGDTVTLQPCE